MRAGIAYLVKVVSYSSFSALCHRQLLEYEALVIKLPGCAVPQTCLLLYILLRLRLSVFALNRKLDYILIRDSCSIFIPEAVLFSIVGWHSIGTEHRTKKRVYLLIILLNRYTFKCSPLSECIEHKVKNIYKTRAFLYRLRHFPAELIIRKIGSHPSCIIIEYNRALLSWKYQKITGNDKISIPLNGNRKRLYQFIKNKVQLCRAL